MSPSFADPFDLKRFVTAQEGVFGQALSELQRGRKESHWMWFIFPQLAGLGNSAMGKRYAIGSLEEAQAYLAHPVLGPRLLQCCDALLKVEGRSATQILGTPDDMKLRSSMSLFALVPDRGGEKKVFDAILAKYFGGMHDKRTRELLGPPDSPMSGSAVKKAP